MELGRRMNLKERLYLTSLGRYRRFGLVPWDLIVSILLVILTTSQMILLVQNGYTYSYGQMKQWNRLFLNLDASSTDTYITNSYFIVSTADLRDYIRNIVNVGAM